VLNAKYHELEAQIIAQAGRKGAVTIATNMAGRGTDIKLGGTGDPDEPWTEEHERLAREIMKTYPTVTRDMLEGRSLESLEVLLLGGLHIIGTERHEARRIDNQLRGRAGRQGDPGSSRFYLSLEDDLMRRFGSDRIAGLMDKLGLEDDQPIEAGVLTSAIENAQTKVEGYNFDIRKHTLQYDDVMNKQREVIYGQRLRILQETDLKPIILDMVADVLESMVQKHLASDEQEEWDLEGLYREVKSMLGLLDGAPGRTLADLEGLSKDEIRDTVLGWAEAVYDERIAGIPPELVHQVERWVLLQVIDNLWTEHLTVLEDVREGIGLRAYGQRDPLVEFKAEAFRLFEELKENIKVEVAHLFYRLRFEQAPPPPPPPTELVTNKEEEAAASGTALRRNGPLRQAAAPAARAQGQAVRQVTAVGTSAAVAPRKVGRNDPCPCGSGKKYKKCHGR
jgi:preprotein translocase subunit SecA